MQTTLTRRQLESIIAREIAAFGPCGPFHRQRLLDESPRELRRMLDQHKRDAERLPGLMMLRQGFAGADLNDPNTADFTARNTSASEISLLGQDANGAPSQGLVNQFCAIAANDARPGKIYRVIAGGVYGTTGTPTLIFTPRWGSSTTIGTNVSLGASGTVTLGSGVSAQPWILEFIFTIRTAGVGVTAGTGKGHGYAILGQAAASASVFAMGKTSASIDTTGQGTAGCGLQMSVTFGTSNASNTITPENWLVTSLN